jgi:hypothetical protein
MAPYEFPLELVRLLLGLGLLIFTLKLTTMFKGGIMHRSWLIMIVVSVVIVLWSTSAILNDLGVIDVALERLLLRISGLALVIAIFVFAAEFHRAWSSFKR